MCRVQGMDMDKMDGSVAYLQKENFIAALKHEVPSPEPMRRCLGFAHRSLSPPFWSRRFFLSFKASGASVVVGIACGPLACCQHEWTWSVWCVRGSRRGVGCRQWYEAFKEEKLPFPKRRNQV